MSDEEQPIDPAEEPARQRPKFRLRPQDWYWLLALLVAGPMAWTLFFRFVPPQITLATAILHHHATERHWRHLDDISPSLLEAAIASQDIDFCSNYGFDEMAEGRTPLGTYRLMKGATIARQAVQKTFIWNDRTWVSKGLEAYFTVLVELLWGKRRIMEVYLNTVDWGGGMYGAEAAAQYYFHHPAKQLSAGESARLVAVLPTPTLLSPLGDGIFFRAVAVEEKAAKIRADGRTRCVVDPPKPES